MDAFKRELSELLKRYPEVESITFEVKQKFTVTKETEVKDSTAPIVSQPVLKPTTETLDSTENIGYETPQSKALTAAEQTMAALKNRANIKVLSDY